MPKQIPATEILCNLFQTAHQVSAIQISGKGSGKHVCFCMITEKRTLIPGGIEFGWIDHTGVQACGSLMIHSGGDVVSIVKLAGFC